MKDSPSKDAVLVTGSSGFIGRHVCKQLAATGRVTVSLYHHRLPESLPNIYPVCSDLSSPELLGAPLRGVSTVIHLAWENNFVGSPSLLQDVASGALTPNLRMLQNLIQAVERSATPRIIFLSAIGASRTSMNPFLREKYLAEFLILNSRIKQKIILRTSIVCGGHDRFLKSIINVMKVPGIYPVPKTSENLAPLHIDDLVALLKDLTTAAMVDPNALIEIAGGERFRIDEIFKLVSDRYAKGSRLPIKGRLGSTLMPLFERNSKERADVPRLRHFLALGNKVDLDTRWESPLTKVLPKTFKSFKEVLAENHWP